MTARAIKLGWFIPTSGDTAAFGVAEKTYPPSLEHFVAVARAAEAAGFSYALVPVQTYCYEAWVTCSMISAKTEHLTMLVAARPGYIQPATMAKMISTFDQLSGGRIYINLIAGPGGAEEAAEGLFYGHDDRYAVMDETVTLMKRLWTERDPVEFDGDFFRVEHGAIRPFTLQKPHPPFYLGGISPAAMEICGKHADVYLAWLDTPEQIAGLYRRAKESAASFGRANALELGLRAQVIVRDTEEEAWAAANALIEHTPENLKASIANMWNQSQANTRMKELSAAEGFRVGERLWSGLTIARPGTGVAIVGSAEQVAETLMEYVELGATNLCLSSYPHHTEATRFGETVLPLLKKAGLTIRDESPLKGVPA